MSAQSLGTAKMYIEQEQYVNAAKQLRPLADGGNAEAQYLAAKLFFEGHINNAKAEEQGVKYATMSADQGYEKRSACWQVIMLKRTVRRHFQS